MEARSLDPDEVIAVVGAGGFIGAPIAKFLGDAGRRVEPVTRHRRGDFQGAQSYWFDGVATAVYAAGAVPARNRANEEYRSSVSAARAVFQAALEGGVKQFVLVSSASVYGTDHEAPVREESPLAPAGEYGQACVQAESIAIAIMQGVDLTIVRPFSVYGRGGHGLVDRLLNAARNPSPLELFAPDSVRDYIHVDEVAQSVIQLIGRPGIFNLGTGIGRTTREVVEMATMVHPSLESVITWKDTASRSRDVSVADTGLATRLGLPIKDRLPAYLEGDA